MNKFKGLGVAVITPFTSNYEVDFNALKIILNHLITAGADYLVMLGTTAESPCLSKDEKRKIIDNAIEINEGRLPIVVGMGGNNSFEIAKEIQAFDFKSIDGILSVSPYYNKPSQEGIYNHYRILAESTDMPFIMYNVPGRTGSNMMAKTSLALAKDFTNIVAIKEASGNLDQIMQIIKNKADDFLVISGDDLLAFPQIAMGMDGVISVIGNAYPAEFSKMIHEAVDNNTIANNIHYKLAEMIRLIFSEGSPAGIKSLMNQLGFCDISVRPPLAPASKELMQLIKIEIQNLSA
jgi:4-hydroxy-tetrahydrodipicolinate synthase